MAIEERLLTDAEVKPSQRGIAVISILLQSFMEIDSRASTTLDTVDLFLSPVGKVEIQ